MVSSIINCILGPWQKRMVHVSETSRIVLFDLGLVSEYKEECKEK